MLLINLVLKSCRKTNLKAYLQYKSVCDTLSIDKGLIKNVSGLISIFLHVHPFGAGLDYIWSYLQKLDPSLRTSEVEMVMARFPSMFQQELSGIGANMERRWIYAGYRTTKPES